MPIINCPECGERVSDAAVSCPHCGYPLSPSSPHPETTSRTRSSPLSRVYKNKPAGIIMLVLGIAMLPLTIFGFLMGIIPGVLMLFGALCLFAGASSNLSGTRNGPCPYCGGKVVVTDMNASAVKCPNCKKRVAIKGDSLETLE